MFCRKLVPWSKTYTGFDTGCKSWGVELFDMDKTLHLLQDWTVQRCMLTTWTCLLWATTVFAIWLCSYLWSCRTARLNIEHVQCSVCWSRKQPELEAGETFSAHIFAALISRCNGSLIYNNAQRELCEWAGHFYTLHPLAAQRRVFFFFPCKPLYVCEVGGYWWEEQLPGMTMISGWVGKRDKRKPHQRDCNAFYYSASFLRPSSRWLIPRCTGR